MAPSSRAEARAVAAARESGGGAENGRIFLFLLTGALCGLFVRTKVDLGLVIAVTCLVGILAVLERRRLYAVIRRQELALGKAESAVNAESSDGGLGGATPAN